MRAVGNNFTSAHSYFQHFIKWFGIFTKSKQTEKNRKQEIIKGEQPYLALTWAAHLASPLGGPAHQGQPRLLPLASRQRRSWARRTRVPPPTCSPASSTAWMPLALPRRPPGTPSHSPSLLSPPPFLLRAAAERSRRRRRASPWPQPLPHLADALRGSASTPSSSSPSHAPREPLQHRHQLRLLPRTPAIVVATPSSPEPPPSCRPIHAMHCEPLNRFPLLLCANSSSSSHFRRDRDLAGAGHVAVVVLAGLRPNQACHHAQRVTTGP